MKSIRPQYHLRRTDHGIDAFDVRRLIPLSEDLPVRMIDPRDLAELDAGLFALSMVAALRFGYLLHFVIDSQDLHSNEVGKHEDLFCHAALELAVSEFVGFVLGVQVRLARDSGA